MKKPFPTSCSLPMEEAAFRETLADWLGAVEQIQYSYQALEKATAWATKLPAFTVKRLLSIHYPHETDAVF